MTKRMQMFDVFCLGLALTVGQGDPAVSKPMPLSGADRQQVADDLPRRIPAALPTVAVPPAPAVNPGRVPGVIVLQQKDVPPAKTAEPKKDAPPAAEKKDGEDKKEEEKKPEEKGHFMQLVDGTCLGSVLEESKIKVDGWAAMSYTYSTTDTTNQPVTWNDRANAYLFQQFWVNIEKPIDYDSKEVHHGFKVAFLAGTDYRFTLIRGFMNDQLKNSRFSIAETNDFKQNLYGVDIPIFTYSVWLPGVGGEGTELTIGRMFCQFGYESVMAPVTPLMSRSYAFNWAPPFFHTGFMSTTKVDKNLTVKHMIVNGNDVFFDGSQEWRYAGQATYTSDDGNDSLSLGTSLGRGKFNAGRPNGPAQGITTIGLAYEPAGRNNINVFDVVFTHKFDDSFSTALELIYGYQQCVPATATGNAGNFNGTSGTAHWGSVVKYLTYNFSDQLTGITRLEAFWDAEGQRTGFEGVYYAGTLGLQFKPMDSVLFRPEVRYDNNPYSRPFQGKHDIFTAGADLIIKF